MKLTAWIMFEAHNFLKVEAIGISGIKEALKKAYDDEYQFGEGNDANVFKGDECIAGWGSLTFDGISSDDLCAFKGLHKKEKIDTISIEHLENAINEKQRAHQSIIDKHNSFLDKLNQLKRSVEPVPDEKIKDVINSLRKFQKIDSRDAELVANLLERL